MKYFFWFEIFFRKISASQATQNIVAEDKPDTRRQVTTMPGVDNDMTVGRPNDSREEFSNL